MKTEDVVQLLKEVVGIRVMLTVLANVASMQRVSEILTLDAATRLLDNDMRERAKKMLAEEMRKNVEKWEEMQGQGGPQSVSHLVTPLGGGKIDA